MEKCYYCGGNPYFVVEWWSLNQFGKNPIVIQEVPVCSSHVILGLEEYYDDLGGADNIMEINTSEDLGLNIVSIFKIIQKRTQLEFCF